MESLSGIPYGFLSLVEQAITTVFFFPRRALVNARGHAIWLRRRRRPPEMWLNLSPASCNTSVGVEGVGLYQRRVFRSIHVFSQHSRIVHYQDYQVPGGVCLKRPVELASKQGGREGGQAGGETFVTPLLFLATTYFAPLLSLFLFRLSWWNNLSGFLISFVIG